MDIEFIPRILQKSEYDWADLSCENQRIGKARCKIENVVIIICSIVIYPEWAGHGYGKYFVDYCKNQFPQVIADRVRPGAVGFWKTMGFHDNNDGTWIYPKPSM